MIGIPADVIVVLINNRDYHRAACPDFFEENPDDHPNASLITEVRSTKDVPKGLRTSGKRKGVKDVTGGMVSKTIASLKMARMGVETWMVNGAVDDRVGRLLKGYDVVGTRFVPKGPNKGGKGGQKE